MRSPDSKRLQCPQCPKKFSRSDHLKRHRLRHSGVKPYSCIFCNDAFTRSDNLRDHYPNCPERRNRVIPEAARGGRRSHACDSCTAMKLGCDGQSPCKTCHHRKLDCRYSRLQSKNESLKNSGTNVQETGLLSERGSIKFLLNTGTASFLDCFQFPTSNERRNLFTFRNNEISNASRSPSGLEYHNEGLGTLPDQFNVGHIDWSLFEDEHLLRFLDSPFETSPMLVSEDFFASMMVDPTIASDAFSKRISISGELDPASVQSAAIIQALLGTVGSLNLDSEKTAEISHYLNNIFAPSRIASFINLYFELWHPHCPFLHQASFNPEDVTLSLLMAVVLMGALFSQVDHEVVSAKKLFDIVELYIFSMEYLGDGANIRRLLVGEDVSEPAPEYSSSLQHLEAAFLSVIIQFWAGTMPSRRRAIETRFGVIIKIIRNLGLTKMKHGQDDLHDEDRWIEKESQIRLMNIATLLDCGFLFFANFPCRLTLPEMNFDLPCEDNVYSSPRPFNEAQFRHRRQATTLAAFQSLFNYKATHIPTGEELVENTLGLSPWDMFLLVHLLYAYTHSHLTQFSPTASSSDTSTTSTPGEGIPNPSVAPIRGALSRWRSLWMTIQSSIPAQTWANMAFFRNGYNYWLVLQLLINNKESVDILMGMEIGCEDTLKSLKVLLRDAGNDTSIS